MLNILIWIFLWYVISRAIKAWSAPNPQQQGRQKLRMLEGLSGMLAKMAKADGHVSKEEVEVAQQFLRMLRLSETEYQFCVSVFNRAVKDGHSISEYARQFRSNASNEARRLVYEFLWGVASADGSLDSREDQILRYVADDLGFDPSVYAYYRRIHVSGSNRSSSYSGSSSSTSPLSDLERAYAKLGCKSSDSDSVLRAAYRKQAMRYHPDRLRAEGMPEGLLEKANQSMAEINAAWDIIKKSRGIN